MNVSMKQLRRLVPHFLSPETVQQTGITIPQLRELVAGDYFPKEKQLRLLARHVGLIK